MTTALAEVAAAAAAADDKTKTPPADAAPEQLSDTDKADIRAAASARGWVPKKAFKGDPEKWVEADKFLERAENEMPLLKARNRKLEKQVSDLTALVGRVVKSTKEQVERGIQQELAKLKDQKVEAVKEGDVDKVEAIDRKIDKVKAEAKDDEPAGKNKGDDGLTDDDKAAYNTWLKSNEWFNTDKRLKKYAEGVWLDFAQNDDDWDDKTLAEQLKAVGKEVRKEFPHKFEKKQKDPPAVEGGGGALGGGGGKKGYADLPAEAKAICDDLVRQKIITREQYLKEYRF